MSSLQHNLSAPHAFGLVCKLLDQLSWTVFIVTRDSSIAYANRAGFALLAEGRLLAEKNGRLTARAPRQSAALAAGLGRCLQGQQPAGAGVPLFSADGQKAAVYFLSMGMEDCCAVMVASSAEQIEVVPELVSTLFDLTPAEARISTLIAGGRKPGEIAHNLQLSVTTVRTHLARAFAKTGTSDQAGLASLIRQIAPPIQLHA